MGACLADGGGVALWPPASCSAKLLQPAPAPWAPCNYRQAALMQEITDCMLWRPHAGELCHHRPMMGLEEAV